MPCVDTRSEAEFTHAHLPQSQNIALLNNDERAIVGTTYKQNGNEAAVLKGYELVGAKFSDYIRQAKKLAPEKKIAVYCWRGGMRSNIMAQLFSNAGFEVSLLIGGYKAFRNFVLDTLKEPRNIWIVGGKTGSNKTTILNLLKEYGAQSIDLEGLANHKGSAFGALGMPPQPSSEMMENMLALQWKNMNPELPLFLENESSKIGSVKINDDITNMMRLAKTITIEKSVEQRMQSIMHEYGNFPNEDLIACTMKLKKRLGGLRMQQAIDFLNENRKTEWLQILLDYYDGGYTHSNDRRTPQANLTINGIGVSNEQIAKNIIEAVKNIS